MQRSALGLIVALVFLVAPRSADPQPAPKFPG
jgi:hypothetical protein